MSEEPPSIETVRLQTAVWKDSRGVHIRRSLITLRRRSSGYQPLDEECDMIGADEAVSMIKNLNSCEDGIYTVEICDCQKDWETGNVDSYRFQLVPVP